MDSEHIDDSEVLYRAALRTQPDVFLHGRPSAALFIDGAGASVDRDGGRNEDDIVASFRSRFRKNDNFWHLVKIGAGDCRALDTCPVAVGNKRNKYHAEIHQSPSCKEIDLLHAMRLAHQCSVVV